MYSRLSWHIIMISQLQCTIDWVDTLSWLANYNVQSIELTHYHDYPTTMYSRLSWHIIPDLLTTMYSWLSWHIILISQQQCTVDWVDTLSLISQLQCTVDWGDTLSLISQLQCTVDYKKYIKNNQYHRNTSFNIYIN